MDQRRSRLEAYIRGHVGELLKQPRAFIHYPFIDPGSVYDGNCWDWDTFWSVYGLFSCRDLFSDALYEKICLHARGNVLNFLDHQQEDGYIPMMIEVAKWPEPYLVMRHKEGVRMNMHKPFLCQQIALISRETGDWSWIAPYTENLKRYFSCYLTYRHARTGLYVWHDDIMIGMDNDPATFGRPHDSTANIFLNSFMVMELRAMEEILAHLGEDPGAYARERERLTGAIQELLWDRRDAFYYSLDVDVETRRYDWFHEGLGVFWKGLPIRIRVWSGFLPMLAGFATPFQAEKLKEQAVCPDTFASPWGICSLAKNEPMFNLEPTINPSNWLGPIWLVVNYAVFRGLLSYGYRAEAERIAQSSLRLLTDDLDQSGCLHEFYSPLDGKPVMNGGFINWNILVLTMLRELEGSVDMENKRGGTQP